MVTGQNLHASDFKIISGRYNEKQDLDQMIIDEFGDHYRSADWDDILAFSRSIEEWADSIALGEGNENALIISNDGYRIWLGRQYFVSRFNNQRPGVFLAHDSINDDFVCLGSWFGLNMHVLAVRK
jgi:hypothetical protein